MLGFVPQPSVRGNAEDNPVGRPAIQQFKGVIEENNAYCGYIVTTSYFTQNAVESAAKNDKLKLIDMTELLLWHSATTIIL